ncbi:30S ribosomal protein S21 [Candidatus Woesebacteria bacterium]|nr:30S ribosomal protein S21 [Candidatus Woesebacteria bacterium]
MPIIIKAQGNDNTNDVIKKFKKAIITTDIVQKAKDRRYFKKPSQVRAAKKIEMNRLRKRARALKKTKNISPLALQRINERLAS